MTVHEVRNRFIEFYANKGYKQLPAYSLLNPLFPHTFLPSAMLALWVPEIEQADIRQSMRIQGCIRATDIDLISTGNHLTFFEMAAAVVLTDEELSEVQEKIIGFCFHFLTKVLGIDNRNLWATVFGGDQVFNIFHDADQVSYNIYIKLGIPKERIVIYGATNNFSGIGEKEIVAGPSTELFYDKGLKLSCANEICLPGHSKTCRRFLELANIVFMIYDRRTDGNITYLVPRNKKIAGSAVGIERVVSITQRKERVAQIEEIESLLHHLGVVGFDNIIVEELIDAIRTIVFMVGSGAQPGHGGRAYVVKKFIRKYLNLLHLLHLPYSVTENIVKSVIEQYQENYKFLHNKHNTIMQIIDKEQKIFVANCTKAYIQLKRLLLKNNESSVLEIISRQYGIDRRIIERWVYK